MKRKLCSFRWMVALVILSGFQFSFLTGKLDAQQRQLTQTDLEQLIQLGIADDAIIAKIKSDGISFTVDEQVLAALKQSGVSQAVLDAVGARPNSTQNPADHQSPILYDDVLRLLKMGIGEQAILERLDHSPTVFTLSTEQQSELKASGASDSLIAALASPRKVDPRASELITNFVIILDCSGSMRESTAVGESKMDTAKQVIGDLVNKIPDGLNVAFIVYGHEVFGSAEDPRNCQAVKVVRPMSQLNSIAKSEIIQIVSGFQPTGATPIALSLRTAGTELAKNHAFGGLVLLTDGLETCNGDPAAEAAELAKNFKLSFGVNVVGFDVKPAESRALADIAAAGKGKYYNAASAKELAEQINDLAKELSVVAQPPVVVDTSKRALRILQPAIEIPAMKEVYLVEAGMGEYGGVFTKIASITKYDENLTIPSSTKTYDVVWVPETGREVYLMRDVALQERRVVDIQPESIFGMIQVSGSGTVRSIFAMPTGNAPSGVYRPVSEVKSYGDVMVVPAGTYDIYVYPESGAPSLLEQEIEIEAGKLYRL